MNNFTKLSRQLCLVCASMVLLFSACKDDDQSIPTNEGLVVSYDAAVPLAWMKLYTQLDRYAEGYRPDPSPRALAYINLAAYEAIMKGMPDYQSLQDLYPGLEMPASLNKKDYHWPTVLNAVYASLLKRFIPSSALQADQQSDLQFKLLALEQSFYDDFESKVASATFQNSKTRGEEVAERIWAWSKTDNIGDDAYLNPRPSNYTPPSGPGKWQPTPPDYGAAVFPFWGEARTFAISQSDKLCRPPLDFSENPNSQFYSQAIEVKNTVDANDFTNQWIAQFWSDDAVSVALSPPARWISIATQVIENEHADLERAVLTYAKVSLALNDASVACWYSKYAYNVERPVSYINRVIDPAWQVHYLGFTPSFPAYPSGHATFGAAAAEVLSHLYGYDYAMTDRTHEGRPDFYGMPRSFASFYEMAEENAYSRIALGVHFRMDAEEGVRLGYEIGRKVNNMPFSK